MNRRYRSVQNPSNELFCLQCNFEQILQLSNQITFVKSTPFSKTALSNHFHKQIGKLKIYLIIILLTNGLTSVENDVAVP